MNIRTTATQHYSRDLQRYYRLPATQVSLTLVLSLVIIAIFIVFALGPTLVAITTLRTTITDSQTTLSKLDAKITTLQTVTKQFDSLKPLLPVLNASVPNTGAAYAPLTNSIEGLAQQTGVALDSESVGPTLLYSRILAPFTPNKGQTVISLPLTVRVIGTYPAVSLFLSQLLSLDRIVSFDSITITKNATGKTGTTNVTMDLNGNAYYLADVTQLSQAIPKKGGN